MPAAGPSGGDSAPDPGDVPATSAAGHRARARPWFVRRPGGGGRRDHVPGRRARYLDGAGTVLAVASIAWTGWTGRSDPSRAVPVAAMQLASVATYLTARRLGAWRSVAAPLAALAVGGTYAVLGFIPPGRGALGYENADAALQVQLAVAAAMASVVLPPGRASRMAAGISCGFVLAASASASVTAVFTLVLAAVLAAAAAGLRTPAAAVALGAVAVLVVVAATTLTGVARSTGAAPDVVDRIAARVDERRVALWGDAADLARQHPLSGAGAGRFQDLSPTARSDPDARWAHSDFLQQAAEGGAVAMALLLAAFAWGFARLWSAGGDTALPALGAMALAALGVHAAIDYLLRFPVLTLVCVALVGTATAPARGRERAAGSPG